MTTMMLNVLGDGYGYGLKKDLIPGRNPLSIVVLYDRCVTYKFSGKENEHKAFTTFFCGSRNCPDSQ